MEHTRIASSLAQADHNLVRNPKPAPHGKIVAWDDDVIVTSLNWAPVATDPDFP